MREGAIVYDEIALDRRPAGGLDRRAGRRHATASRRRDGEALFGHNVGPNSWKSHLFPPRLRLWRARRDGDGGLEVEEEPPTSAALRVHRRALLRPARDRRPGPHLPATARTPTATTRRGGATASSSRSTAARPAARASASRWAPGPKADGGLRPRAHRAARRRRPPLPRRGGQRARGGGARRAAAPAPRRPADERGGRARRSQRAAAEQGRELDTDRHPGPALRQPRAPALGRGRRPLPVLRQLHAGLPDLLLHHGRGRHRPRRRARPSTCASWDSCFTLEHSYIHGGSVRGSTPLALPAVDDPQARHLDRPVRHLGLRRLRALHHLVPGGDRHHRGGGRDPGDDLARSGPMRTIDDLLAEVPAFAGMAPRAPRADRRAARATACSRTASTSLREGDPADAFFVIRDGARRARDLRPAARRAARSRRCTTATWSAGRGSSRRTGRSSTCARSATTHAIAFDGACLRGKCDADPVLGYDLMRRFAAGDRRAPAGERGCGCIDVYGHVPGG